MYNRRKGFDNIKKAKQILGWQYLVIAEPKREWLGLRYFKFSIHTDTVTQIVESTGLEKRGRGHLFGIYLMSRQSLFSNYMAMGYAIPCSEKEYLKAFDRIIEMLK